VFLRWEFLSGCRHRWPGGPYLFLATWRHHRLSKLNRHGSSASTVVRATNPLQLFPVSYGSSTLLSVSGAAGRNANGWVCSGLQLANDDKYSDEDGKTAAAADGGKTYLSLYVSCRRVHLPLVPFLSPYTI